MTRGTWRMLAIWTVGAVAAAGGYATGWLDPLATAMVGAVMFTLGIEVRTVTERMSR